MYNDEARDRMIVDRRGPNGSASSSLFPTYRLKELSLRRFKEGLRGSGTDRKDMYYQCAASRERAASNILGPSLRRDQLSAFSEELRDFDAGELEARARPVWRGRPFPHPRAAPVLVRCG